MLPQRYLIAIMLTVLWSVPFFFKYTAPRQKAVAKDVTARIGIILQVLARGAVWILPQPYVPTWRILLGIAVGLFSILIVQYALRHLDKQWRLDAALSADHQLIRTGPYALLRHPIYAAMFLMVLGTGFILAPWQGIVAGAILHIAGTEVRIRSEEKLLRSRFGEDYDTWARHVWAYMPFIR